MLARKILLITGFITLVAASILIERHYNRPIPGYIELDLNSERTGIEQGYYHVEQPIEQPDFQASLLTTASAETPTSSVSSSVRISFLEEAKKRWAKAEIEKNPHLTSKPKRDTLYQNKNFGISFSFPSGLFVIKDVEDETWGTLFVELENEDLYPHTIQISVRDGKRFNAEQDKYEHDITYYNWDYVYDNFRNKIAQPWEELGKNERLVIIGGRKFLKRVIWDPERNRHMLSFLTYENSMEYDTQLIFYYSWIKDLNSEIQDNFDYLADGILENHFFDEHIIQGTKALEAIVKNLQITTSG